MAVSMIGTGPVAQFLVLGANAGTTGPIAFNTTIPEGSFLVALLVTAGNGRTHSVSSAGLTFTPVSTPPPTAIGGTAGESAVFTAWATSDLDSSDTITGAIATGATVLGMAVYAFSGVNPSEPLGSYSELQGPANTASIAFPSMTAIENGYILALGMKGSTSATVTGVASGYSLISDLNMTGATSNRGIFAYGRAFTSTQSSAPTGTLSNSASRVTGYALSLVPEDSDIPAGTCSFIWSTQDRVTASVTAGVSSTSSVRLALSTNSDMSLPTLSDILTPNTYGIVRANLAGLTADTTYYYQVMDTPTGGTSTAISNIGSFKTFKTGSSSYTFAFGSCHQSAAPEDSAWLDIYDWEPKFLVHLGDWHYSGFANTTVANAVAEITDQIRDAAGGAFKEVLEKIPTFYTGSDHDVRDGDNLDNTDSKSINFHDAWFATSPYTTLPAVGEMYRAWTDGNVRYILLDTRSNERSPGLDTQSPTKTMLGLEQKNWLFSELDRPEPVKFIFSDVPWYGPAALDQGEDKWWAYANERQEIADYIVNNNVNVAMFHGDAHCVQYITAEDNDMGGFPIFGAAPFSNVGGGRYLGYATEYYSTGTTTEGSNYGRVTVTDDGEELSVNFVGFDAMNGIARITHTHVFSIVSETLQIWDGSSTISVEKIGVWNGSSVDNVELLGVWNGSSVDAI